MSKAPDQSLPQAMQSDAATEAAYRFLNNERVDFDTLLAPELARTTQAVLEAGTALVLHDSSAFMFGGEAERDDIGSLDGYSPGFLGHFALAVSAGEGCVLGLLGIETLLRPEGPRRVPVKWTSRYASNDKESLRWARMVDRVDGLVERRAPVIHVMDSEGDSYELLDHLVRHDHRFVVRAKSYLPRRTTDGHLAEALAQVDAVVCRQVPLQARSKAATRGRKNKREPREPRLAKLHISARAVEVLRPAQAPRTLAPSLRLNVIHVFEVETPDGEEPVDWKLYTSEPIATPADIVAVVDFYRRRWTIEEYFKALKTGCAYQKRQLENRRALLNALALLAPIACKLLALRNDCRVDAPASTVLTPTQLTILRVVSRRLKSSSPTAREVMLAVAGLGGHLKHNGEPGWQSLGRGYLTLLEYKVGWDARSGCDQS